MHKVDIRADELSGPFRRFIPRFASLGWTWTKIAFPEALGRLFTVGAMAISGAAAINGASGVARSNGATPNGSGGGGAPGSGRAGGSIIGPSQIITNELAVRDYRFSLLSRVRLSSGEDTDLWAARDAVVLKALALVLAGVLPVSPRCTHIKGHGGAKFAVREVRDHLEQNRFVLRTDVKSYYASINHLMLLDQLAVYIRDRRLLNLLGQYLRRTSERGGSFWDFEKGISLGCPLSPLMGAFFLYELDTMMARAMGRNGPFYVRYMDDILVLSRTRWGLRRAVAAVNRVLQGLDLSQHPDKTFIGRIERGFDFLGYHFSRDADGVQALGLADITVAKFKEKLFRLYEQARHATTSARSGRPRGTEPSSFDIIATLQLQYVRRWLAWAHGGLNNAAADPHYSGFAGGHCGSGGKRRS